MKRLIAVLLVLSFTLSLGLMPAAAQDAPKGTWLGSWPYVLPPDHTLNVFASNGLPDNLGAMFESYVELPLAIYNWDSNTYTGLLADKWGFSSDFKTYNVTLKSGAKWSDGSAITADDLITTYSIDRILNTAEWPYLSAVEKVDDLNVKFTFKNDASPLAERAILKTYIAPTSTYGDIAKKAIDVVASGKKSDSDEWKAVNDEISSFKPDTLVASGPYTYALSDVGAASMTLNWQPNSLYSSSVKFGAIKIWQGETEQSTPLVLSGEVAHSTDVYPPATIDQFKAQGIRLITVPRGYGPALLFNHTVAPWNIKEVRQATALIINREQNAFLTGAGATATVYMSGLLDDNVPQLLSKDTIDKLDKYAFDTDRASKLLEGIGYTKNADGKWADKDGKTIAAEFKFPAEFADFAGAAQDAIAQMNAFGYDITARSIPWQETSKAIQHSDFQLSVWSWGNQSPFASRQFFGPTQRFNTGHLASGLNGISFDYNVDWNGTKVNLDDLITNASSSMDNDTRIKRADEVALIINNVLPFIPLNVEQSVEPFNEKLISGAPADGDPILKNPTGSDHWIISYLLEGKLSPGPDAK